MSTLTRNTHTTVDASSSAVSMTFPTSGLSDGDFVSLEKADASTNAVTVTGRIRGVAAQTLTLSLYREAISFRYRASDTSWYPVSDHKTLPSLDARTSAAIITRERTPKVRYIDVWTGLFDSGQISWITGQNLATRATTAAVAAGDTLIPVTDATGITAGYGFVTNWGTATQQVHRVLSVSGNNVTVATPVVTPLASGAQLASLWTNPSHLTTDAGFYTLGQYIASAKLPDGSYCIDGTTPKVTYLGNSWFALGSNRYADTLHLRLPGATVVNAGVGGNTTAMMLARFDTDVPSDSTHVVLFEHVNNTYQSATAATQASDWEALVAKVKAIGAIPIIVGPVPLSDFPTPAVVQNTLLTAMVGNNATTFPAVGMAAVQTQLAAALLIHTPGTGITSNVGLGPNTLNATTGGGNSALGEFAGQHITTGLNNSFFGRQAGTGCTTGQYNVGVGQGALFTQSTATGTVGIGGLAGFLNTASSNTFIGHQAGYAPNNVTTNATTTGAGHTFVGYQSGLGSATQATAATALGYKTTADGSGSVAIGTDSGAVGAAASGTNDFVLGTANHKVRIPGKLTTAASTATQAGIVLPHGTAPTTPADGAVWTTTAGMFVRVNGVTKTVTLT